MQIKRKHHAITQKQEKVLLDFLAQKVYRHITANQLSTLALLGATIASLGYILAHDNLGFLHLTNFGVFLHWLGDSLDGRTARLRKESRPKYGHYLDHMMDSISLVIIIFGINYSNITFQSAWTWVLALFLLTMIHSFLKASVTGKFDLSFERLGPTEARIALILMNLSLIATNNPLIVQKPFPFNLIDLFGAIAAFVLLATLVKTISTTLWGKDKIKETY